MPRGDKSRYSDKQQRKAEHIEESYKAKGVSESEAGGARLGDGEQAVRRRRAQGRFRPR